MSLLFESPSVPRLGEFYVKQRQQSEQEIWLMEDVFKLETMFPDPFDKRWTVGGVLPEIQKQILQHYQMYDYLIQSLREHGQVVPVRITSDGLKLRDGIHRVAIADSLGWPSLLVDRSPCSTWEDWDNSEEGKAYYGARWGKLQSQGSIRVL